MHANNATPVADRVALLDLLNAVSATLADHDAYMASESLYPDYLVTRMAQLAHTMRAYQAALNRPDDGGGAAPRCDAHVAVDCWGRGSPMASARPDSGGLLIRIDDAKDDAVWYEAWIPADLVRAAAEPTPAASADDADLPY